MAIIGIDCDGVLRNFGKAFLKVMRGQYPQNFDETQPLDWELSCVTGMDPQEISDLYNRKHAREVYVDALPLRNSVEAYQKIKAWAEEKGHELVCVTSQKEWNRCLTMEWLAKYGFNFRKLIFATEKCRENLDFLVDDSPEFAKTWVDYRGEEGLIIFDAHYNQDAKGEFRITNLLELMDLDLS